jgi:hypothetical protein
LSSVVGMVPAECVSSTVLAATIAAAEGKVGQAIAYAIAASVALLHCFFLIPKVCVLGRHEWARKHISGSLKEFGSFLCTMRWIY